MVSYTINATFEANPEQFAKVIKRFSGKMNANYKVLYGQARGVSMTFAVTNDSNNIYSIGFKCDDWRQIKEIDDLLKEIKSS